ncbi:MAG: Uma2 family endonuclease [Actinomycetota bacterium]|jgi:Uma2 family endonuclease|nr:Uma2 family endonuclease [Actinomycetota bacterium]
MSAAPDLYGRGPYTVEDLDLLPEEGKRFELVHGWLISLSPSVRHDECAQVLRELIARSVRSAGAEHLVVRGPWDLMMPGRNIYVPDIAVFSRAALVAAYQEDRRAVDAADVALVVEIVRPGSGSEKTVRQVKRVDYATAGVPSYWIVDLEPEPRVTLLEAVGGGGYSEVSVAVAGTTLHTERPVPISFDPGVLLLTSE